MPNGLRSLFHLILIFGLPPFLVLTAVHLFLNPSWISFEYGRPDFPKAELFTDQARLVNATESLLYCTGDRTRAQFVGLGVYNDREIKHMTDVRILIERERVFYGVDVALLAISLVALGWWKENRRLAARGLFRGGALTIVLFFGIALFAATGFNSFFTLFHRVFFEGDTWLFYETDSLIQFYPLPFWIDTVFGIVGSSIVGAIIVSAIGWFWGRRIDAAR
jgi:integral membrane protein (TIGR01906 family)